MIICWCLCPTLLSFLNYQTNLGITFPSRQSKESKKFTPQKEAVICLKFVRCKMNQARREVLSYIRPPTPA